MPRFRRARLCERDAAHMRLWLCVWYACARVRTKKWRPPNFLGAPPLRYQTARSRGMARGVDQPPGYEFTVYARTCASSTETVVAIVTPDACRARRACDDGDSEWLRRDGDVSYAPRPRDEYTTTATTLSGSERMMMSFRKNRVSSEDATPAARLQRAKVRFHSIALHYLHYMTVQCST